MKRSHHAIAFAAALLLAACGGGKGGADNAGSHVSISGRAVDGPLQGAFACYDSNDNHACDAGEPRSAATGADGSFTIAVPREAAGRHAVVVEVPAEAIDADTAAPVGQAFVMRAPATGNAAAHNVFVSPLTTLVHAQMVHGGLSLGAATQAVRNGAGLGAYSPLADFSVDISEPARHAARVARITQLAANAQVEALGSLVGTPARGGDTISAALLEREVQLHLLALLPLVAEAAAESALAAASPAQLQVLLAERAQALATQSGLDAQWLRATATAQRMAEPPAAATPVATAALLALTHTDADTWFYRTLQSSAADNVVDANGRLRYHDVRVNSAAASAASAPALPGVMRRWSWSNAQAGSEDLHWTGSAWVACRLTDRYTAAPRDSLGNGSYDFCNGRETGVNQRRVELLEGLSIEAVVRDRIRTFPGGSSGVAYANWGPSNLSVFAGATFPPGSILSYQSTTPLTTAVGYTPTTANQVLLFNAAVAAGGDVRVNSSLACNDPLQTAAAAQVPATTLEDMISRMPGRPCIFNQGGTAPNQTLSPNEWWGNSTVNLGDLNGANTRPSGTGNVYNTIASLRVGFAPSGDRVSFYRCYRFASNSSPRNCTLIGIGRYSIQNLSDGRLLSFSATPALVRRLANQRVFVQRGGRVYYGFKNPTGGTTMDLRLNLAAANAVLERLPGVPRITPVTQPGTATGQRAANLATLEGAWGGNDATTATVFRFGPNGRFWMAEAKPFLSQTREQAGAELGWFDHDPVTGQISTLLEVDSNLTSGTSHGSDSDPPITITPTQISNGSGFALGRLGNDATGLVGMWAVTSATDFSVPHLVFFANGRVLFVDHSGGETQTCSPTLDGPPGAEYATWSYDATSGNLTISGKIHDTNGCAGLFDSSAAGVAAGLDNAPVVFPVTFGSNGLTMQLGGPRGSNETWFRIPVQ